MGLGRDVAIDYIEDIVSTVDTERLPVPVRELWVYGEIALGLDPLDRVNVYVAKEILLPGEQRSDPGIENRFDIKGIGKSIRLDWAEQYPHYIRANANGYAAPEKCLGAQLLPTDEPFHLEVCNTGFEDNVSQRLNGALARGVYDEIVDPRGVCLWKDGVQSPTAIEKLRNGEFVFPPLAESLEMLGASPEEANNAATVLRESRKTQSGATIRSDVV